MKIEFFHDVICSFCFPMSYRMREIEKLYPEIEIIHRSFPLVWEVKTFDLMFGNRKNAKQEILKHWQHADENDDLHRFNIEGMQKQIFDFPSSKNALLAAKASVVKELLEKEKDINFPASILFDHDDVTLIIDEDAASTICAGAQAIKDLGAIKVLACCTHPVLSGPAIERLEASVIEKLITTDTIALSKEKQIDKIKVVSVAEIIATVIDHIENVKPVSEAIKNF